MTQVATVPTACGIETKNKAEFICALFKVATVPTACGIETVHPEHVSHCSLVSCNSTYRLRY